MKESIAGNSCVSGPRRHDDIAEFTSGRALAVSTRSPLVSAQLGSCISITRGVPRQAHVGRDEGIVNGSPR